MRAADEKVALAKSTFHNDVTYYKGPDAGERHKLDILTPKNQKDFPVVIFVHGGTG